MRNQHHEAFSTLFGTLATSRVVARLKLDLGKNRSVSWFSVFPNVVERSTQIQSRVNLIDE